MYALSHQVHWPHGSAMVGQRPLHTPPPVSSIQTPGKCDRGAWMICPKCVCNVVEGLPWPVLSVAPQCWMCPSSGWFPCVSGAHFDMCWWHLRLCKQAGLSQSINILSVCPCNSNVKYFSFHTSTLNGGPL